ncbi:Predicted AMP-dependent synthetase and ligase [gamma proteobacterium HdN1]|nr:Predicted AMP-dependent synthetase and ligase [gamma proteobacterium HdN1]
MSQTCQTLAPDTSLEAGQTNPSFRAISALLIHGRPSHHTIGCTRSGAPILWGEWHALVLHIERQLATYPQGAWAVHCENPLHTAAALYALWRQHSSAWLTGNTTTDTCQTLESKVLGWISDSHPETSHPCINPTEMENCDPLSPKLTLFAPRKLDDIAVYIQTSGSSGQPKSIAKTFAQLQAEINNLQILWGTKTANTTIVASVSHQHLYGLLFRLLWPLCSGNPILCETLQYPEQWHTVTSTLGHVTWVSSPAFYRRMQSHLDWASLNENIHAAFSSGGALPDESGITLQKQLGQPVIEVFGSSETGGVGWRTTGNPWTCFHGVNVSLSSEDALIVQSDYLADSEPIVMGDRAELLDPQHFRIYDRLDRIVKIEEKRVSLPQLEAHLIQHPWVEDACMVPLALESNANRFANASKSKARQAIGAIVTLKSEIPFQDFTNRKALINSLKQHMAAVCEPIASPKKWRFVSEIPANAQGKRQVSELLSLFSPQKEILFPEFLRTQQDSHDCATFLVAIPARLSYFRGHFDRGAILPGVVQINWAWTLAAKLWEIPQTFSDLETLKFQRVITPHQIVQISLRYDAEKKKLNFKFESSKGLHSSGRISLRHGVTHD